MYNLQYLFLTSKWKHQAEICKHMLLQFTSQVTLEEAHFSWLYLTEAMAKSHCSFTSRGVHLGGLDVCVQRPLDTGCSRPSLWRRTGQTRGTIFLEGLGKPWISPRGPRRGTWGEGSLDVCAETAASVIKGKTWTLLVIMALLMETWDTDIFI